ncbi:3-hydroxyacyl-CoA dehydrogenase NAD-binding domain-containing protein [Rhodothermus profundi]|uniref:3-hydroxybutyryl-CoA dehydrogenase n=1 Tax=Rhodothermus profundi TaxID=633813 RepID=A0A1M6PAN2_9BACT|nr:3-hydroxyacyl-CoA dehydrogenase NAD-binding domain-containing protein [Rhodothermus profundi]SHK04987.1 3-hydroxybutyryl-CoA dehydrogenase [Rhodothermus profundi]
MSSLSITFPDLSANTPVGIIGAGTMGRGIAQVAATSGHSVFLHDTNPQALESARAHLKRILERLVEKGKLPPGQDAEILGRITFLSDDLKPLAACGLIIEAIVEDLAAKQTLFAQLERQVAPGTILATNTSSLSVTAIAAACQHPERVLGLHFFNPAPLMPLVEVVPGVATASEVVDRARTLMEAWGKTPVVARDTPGFIVNRVARPFYGEALRILEEGIADVPTIDWAMRTLGGFRMGPFELMDLIGNDINYRVTETLWKAFFYEPRYRPSFTQQRMVEAGRLGRKTGIGFYDYREGATNPAPTTDPTLGQQIFQRILAMLINEAVDAVFWQIASPADLDLAMTRGVNYPRGLLHWADELGLETVLGWMEALYETYREDRYRPSPLFRQMIRQGARFFEDAT